MKTCIIINSDNFPYGLASVQKIKLLGQGFYEHGYKVYVLNMFSNLIKSNYPNHKPIGKFNNIIYLYTSGITYKISKFKKILYFPLSLIKELNLLNRLIKKSSDVKVILQFTNIFMVIYYRIFFGLYGIKLFTNTMELHKESIKGRLFDKYNCRFSKGVFVISHKLKQMTEANCPKTSTLVIPASVDFGAFEGKKSKPDYKNYSLFCGGAAYHDTFKFIIKSFEKIAEVFTEHKLLLIANGKQTDMNRINNIINESPFVDNISVYSSLEYENLISFYLNAQILLIPLLNNPRDKARFPHKIGEYAATKRPILTTNIGEISYYFKDGVNAFIAKTDNIKEYSNKWSFVLENKSLANEVGQNGYKLGLKHFNYSNQVKKMIEFMNKV